MATLRSFLNCEVCLISSIYLFLSLANQVSCTAIRFRRNFSGSDIVGFLQGGEGFAGKARFVNREWQTVMKKDLMEKDVYGFGSRKTKCA